jgi:hypothetical protein
MQKCRNKARIKASVAEAYIVEDYNPSEHDSVSDGPEAYNNPSFGRHISEYTEACKQKYGKDYNPSEHDIDTDEVMTLGGGKKHGRLWIGDGIIKSSSLRLADVRARRTESDP